ncbi:hypothetical protein GCM10010358_54320 [Streptomyces minutiscleroticus]|uniref:Uncharacterized protein n=1 Tax=Streptomyces minutiscleroticus TaxID=68238 RepID=A0A918NSZ7_9ACTN|nr:hypothetical protein GCM10010358_54320 [Streptomyces minutiscleroticus]
MTPSRTKINQISVTRVPRPGILARAYGGWALFVRRVGRRGPGRRDDGGDGTTEATGRRAAGRWRSGPAGDRRHRKRAVAAAAATRFRARSPFLVLAPTPA